MSPESAQTTATIEAENQPARKPWAEMSDQEQLDAAKAEGYQGAHIDAERDTLVLGDHESDEASRQAEREDFLEKVGKLTAENPDRPDVVKDELGLSAGKLNEMGYTRLSELQAEAQPVYEARKALAEEAAEKAAYEARAKEVRDAHEAAWAANEAYAEKQAQEKAQAERDEEIAGMSAAEVFKMSTTELAEATGMSYGEALRAGKLGAAAAAGSRVAERQAAEEDAAVMQLPDNTEAEQRQSEYAAMLREHDRAMLQGSEAVRTQADEAAATSEQMQGTQSTREAGASDSEEEVSVEGEEAVVVEPREGQRSLKDRLRAVKNAFAVLPSKIMNRERREGPMTPRQKAVYALGTVAAGVVGIVIYKAAKDLSIFSGGSGGGKSEVSQAAVDNLSGRPPTGGTSLEVAADMLDGQTRTELAPAVTITASPEDMGIDTSQVSWNVANQLSPGSENAVMQAAIDKFNAAHGTNFALAPAPTGATLSSGEPVRWIMDGPQAINPAQMEELNRLMRFQA